MEGVQEVFYDGEIGGGGKEFFPEVKNLYLFKFLCQIHVPLTLC